MDSNGIRIAYDTFGLSAHRPVLLIHGLNMQMLALSERENYVIRFDNRDAGHTT